MSYADLKNDLEDFGEQVTNILVEMDILEQCKKFQIDHIGLRIRAPEMVDYLHSQILKEGILLSSSIVNERKIFIFELNEPLSMGYWRINCIELPYPKSPHLYHKDGWEHVEFVIPSQAISLNSFRKEFKRVFNKISINRLKQEFQYKEMTPFAKDDKFSNPTISVSKAIGLTVKFHPRGIKEIIA